MRFEKNFNVAYSQIYIVDGMMDSLYNGYSWTDEDFNSMLCVQEGFLIIGTARSLVVPFCANISNERPEIVFDLYSHIVECSIETITGIRIFGDFDEEEYDVAISFDPGVYGVLACYKDLDSISFDGLEGNDSYHVFLWPSERHITKKVLKQWVNEQRGIGTGFYQK
jgi:hypothetical protein